MEKDKLIRAVKNFHAKKIAVVGDVVLDKYIFGRVERVNPESPAAPLLKIEKKEYRLGCAANVAANISKLKTDVKLFCVIGDDFYKPIFENMCGEQGIELFNVLEGETIVKERAIESEFNKYLMRADDGESNLKPMSSDSEDKLVDAISNSDVDAIVLSDYDKQIFRGRLAERIIEWAGRKDIPVVVDPKPGNINSFSSSTILCPNIKEAREIVGNDGNEKDVVRRLREKVNSKYMMVTCGKKGMIVYDGDEFITIATKARDLVDVTGAGDTVTSLIALSLVSGLSLGEAAHVANHAAGVVIGKQGTSSLTQDELIKDLLENVS